MLLFFKLNFNRIELQMKFDISNVKFHLKIYIELDFGDNEFYTKFDFNKLDFVKIEFKKQRHFAK